MRTDGNYRHGMTGTRVHNIWRDMIKRCRHHPLYNGRVRVCERWMVFENFYADMGDPPPGLSIDRKNNDGDYEPGNCRWATQKEQARNRRTSRKVGGVTIAEIAEKMGAKQHTIARRLRLGLELPTPIRECQHRFVVCEGKHIPLMEWSHRAGVSYSTLISRLKHGWSSREVLFGRLRHSSKSKNVEHLNAIFSEW